MIKYVKMCERHIDGMIEIEEQCFSSGFARKTFEKELQNKLSVYVVAEEDEKVIGYAGLWNICGEADIMNVGVHRDFRRRGVAYEMIKYLIELAEEDGAFAVNLEVRKSNSAARALYKKLGFYEIGIREKYYDGKEDAVLMKLDVTEGKA